jgi:hypothetical protein
VSAAQTGLVPEAAALIGIDLTPCRTSQAYAIVVSLKLVPLADDDVCEADLDAVRERVRTGWGPRRREGWLGS